MKILIALLALNFVNASSDCDFVKLNLRDEVLMQTVCEDICIIRALNVEAREYIGIKNKSGTNSVLVYKYLDTPNFLHEAIWEASDIIKIYNSSPTNPNIATIAKYNKTAKTIEIIEKNYNDSSKSKTVLRSCK